MDLLGFFFSVFLFMAVLELIVPRRELSVSRARRWGSNIGIVVLNTVVVRLLFPTAAVGVALFAGDNGYGLFNNIPAPLPVAVVASVVALDLLIYGQHVVMHKVPVLWRLHRNPAPNLNHSGQ